MPKSDGTVSFSLEYSGGKSVNEMTLVRRSPVGDRPLSFPPIRISKLGLPSAALLSSDGLLNVEVVDSSLTEMFLSVAEARLVSPEVILLGSPSMGMI